MAKKLVVIGGVAAGMSAAAKARRTDQDMEIAVYTDEEYISYAGCGLPYFIGGVVSTKEKVIARTVGDFAGQNIPVHTFSRVESIDPDRKEVSVRDLQRDVTFEDHYDKLIIATGARALIPPLKGIGLEGVFTLRNVNDSIEIKEFIVERNPQEVTIIGGGYIGLEMAENFHEMGCKVTIIERAPHIIPNMDEDMAAILTEYLQTKGVEVRTGESVEGFEGEGVVSSVVTDKGELPTDFVLLSIGVLPNSDLAANSGVELGVRNAIKVDERMRTSVKDILAAGDCCTVRHLVTGGEAYIPLGTTANKQGRIAGENAAGGSKSFPGVIGTGIARVMDMEVSRTGLSERECQMQGIQYESRQIKARTAAYYCPKSQEIHLKLIAAKDSGRLLGAQIVGYQGAAMRIDMMAVAITNRATVGQLVNMDLAYSPPFSPVWDPMLIALNQF